MAHEGEAGAWDDILIRTLIDGLLEDAMKRKRAEYEEMFKDPAVRAETLARLRAIDEHHRSTAGRQP